MKSVWDSGYDPNMRTLSRGFTLIVIIVVRLEVALEQLNVELILTSISCIFVKFISSIASIVTFGS